MMKISGKYSDYLIIDKEFEPVFNEEVDRTRKGLWKSFIPHSKFEEVLDRVIRSLERASPSDAKSLWIYGAYGTGKTHAVFVIKHLLEDDIEEVEDYFAKRKISDTLRKRLLALREREKILVIFKSGAGYVRTPERLILEIQDSIFRAYKKYLESHGLEYRPSKTDIELLRERINENIINWDSLINKYRRELKEVTSVEDIRRIINDDESIDLDFVERLLCVLEKEGISTLRPSTDRFKSWLRELFEANIITRIVFIWDEFSGFFQPGAPLDVLQELAHITQELPFYLLIVTHRHLEHWEQTLTEDVKKLKDRFHFIHYTMEPITVYRLISNVVYPKDEKKWDWYRELLWMNLDSTYNLKNETHRLIEYEMHTELNDFKKLIPIHPYTAYLSARIIQWFGSSQRTLFKFLKSEEKSSFVEFLSEYPKDNWYLLTADFLWDYYFASNDEIITFYPEVLGIVNYWNSQKDKLDENELRVFKVVMLLSALAKKVEQEKYLRPLLTTLKLALAGTPLYSTLESILKQLVSKGILREDKLPTDKEYWIPTHDISPDIIEEIKKTLPNFSEFIKQIEKLFEDLKPHRRAIIRVVSAEDVLGGKIPAVRAKPYQIEVILILMKALERIEDLKKKVKELSQECENVVFIISLQELGENNWETILTNMAYEKALKQSNKEDDARRYRAEIEEIISNWISNVRKGRYCIIYKLSEDMDVTVNERVEGESGVQKIFKEIVRSIFPYGLDEIILSEPLWKYEYSKEGLRVAIEEFRTKAKKGRFSKLYNRFVMEDQILDKEGNFTGKCEFDDHPLCKMRERIRGLFDKNESISLSEIWEILQNPPFGLYPSPLGSFILGILMKEYSEGGYYYTDGVTQGEINPTKMVEILYDVIKSQKEWKLLKLSLEHRKFCELIKKIFKLSDEDVKYPKMAIISLRNKIKNQYRYPLWMLTFVIHSDESLFDKEKEILVNLITKLDDIIKTLPIEERSSDVEITKDTEQLIRELITYIDEQDSYIVNELTEFVRIDKFNDSFNIFVRQYIDDPRIDIQLVDKKLRERLQEEPWAWTEDKVKEILNKMQLEIELTNQLSKLFGINEVFIEETCREIRNKIKSLDFLPLWIYCYHPEVNEDTKSILLEIEKVVYSNRPLELSVNFKEIIEKVDRNVDNIIKVLNESEEALRSWVYSKLNRELSDIELNAVFDRIKEIVKEDKKVEESQLLKEIRDVLKRLKVTVLQERVKQKLEDIFGTSDVLQFYRSNLIPIALIKYLPEIENAELPPEISTDEFFRDLTKLNTLSEQKLELYVKILESNKQIFQVLNERDIWVKLFKNFFGKEWIEGVFTDDDLKDLRGFLMKSLGEKVENWDDHQIRREFDKWKKIKYKERFYDRIRKMLSDLDESEVRNLLFELIEYTDIGLRILDLIKDRMSLNGGNS